jgi:HD-like signal output (HDOD) protein/CheY-like chemotaxis protein
MSSDDTSVRAKVLFVDDEKEILNALRRALRKEIWESIFVESSADGMKVLEEQDIDLVVSDIRMPYEDGLSFLKRVKASHPRVGRLALTGYAELNTIQWVIGEAGVIEVLTKPWEDQELKQVIHEILESQKQRNVVGDMFRCMINDTESLPVLPDIYYLLCEQLQDLEKTSIDHISGIIESDSACSFRLLKWANSTLFGQKKKVDSIKRAIVVLGLEMVKGLVTTMFVLDTLADKKVEDVLKQDDFWQHSLATGFLGRMLADKAGYGEEQRDRVFIAGLLHDIGKILLAMYMPEQFELALTKSKHLKRPLHCVERELYQTDHAQMGGLLANWWMIPDFISDAITYHHQLGDLQKYGYLVQLVNCADVLADRFAEAESFEQLEDVYNLLREIGVPVEDLPELKEVFDGFVKSYSKSDML